MINLIVSISPPIVAGVWILAIYSIIRSAQVYHYYCRLMEEEKDWLLDHPVVLSLDMIEKDKTFKRLKSLKPTSYYVIRFWIDLESIREELKPIYEYYNK